MLAKVYKGEYEEDMKFIQPKLDGVRCNISLDGGKIISKSRKNKKFYSTTHIEAELSEIFEKYPDLHLDGELYNHDLHDDFNKIVSLVKKQKITENDKSNIESTVRYYVYDAWFDTLPDAVFHERFEMVREALLHLKNVVIVPTYKIGCGKDIDYYFNMFTSNGYEGAIIRLDKPYEHKRSSNLLKYKKFQDDEFEIIEVNIGKTNTIAESLTIRLKNGNLCNATLAFPDEKCKEILENKDKYIGKMATVCYFGITNDGMLRFPVVKSFNREEYE
jgi:DNA ligase-1